MSEPAPVDVLERIGGRSDAGRHGIRARARASAAAGALAVAFALIACAALWSRHLDVHLGAAAPLLGHLSPRVGPLLIPALAVAGTAVTMAPRLAERLPFRWLLVASWLVALCWALALAATDGASGITHPLSTPDEYLPDLAHVHSLSVYLAEFTAHVHDPPPGTFTWSVHVAGGGPGTLLIFAVLARIGLGGPVWASLLVIFVGTSSVPAATLVARYVDGAAAARRAAPFLMLAPMAIWVATSADALFLGLSAWGIALLAAAARRSTQPGSDALGVLGGLTLGAALYCSYGIVPLGAVAVAVVVCARRIRPLFAGAVGLAVVAAAFAAFGFWWWTGLDATRVRYAHSIARVRPYGYFLLADLAAFAIAIGPAAIAGLTALHRRSRLWWPVGGALLAVAVSDLSGLSKGEVERIWLPFAVWALLAAAALGDARARRRWLAAQVVLALVVQSVLVSNW